MADSTAPVKSAFLWRAIARWGEMWLNIFSFIGGVSYLLSDVTVWLLRATVLRRVRLGRTAVITQLVRIGYRSVTIVALVSGCIGFILALQMAPPLQDFGQVDKIANIIGVAVFRELGPLIAAVVLTGFAGASIAAELGTMVVGEEIEALEAHALNPVRFLVLPRVLAAMFALMALTVIGDLVAVFFGGGMTVVFLGVPYELYKANTLNQVVYADFLTGIFKAGVFGLLLGSIACYNGLKVTGGAAGVGKATTDTVVQSVVWIILFDLIFTGLFYAFGWT